MDKRESKVVQIKASNNKDGNRNGNKQNKKKKKLAPQGEKCDISK